MRQRINELRQERAKLITQARSMIDLAEKEKRALSSEEQSNWDTLMNKADEIRGQYERLERQLMAEADLSDPVTAQQRDERSGQETRIEFRSRSMRATDSADPEWRNDAAWQRAMATGRNEYRRAFAGFVRRGANGMTASPEARALQADLQSGGGFLLAPIQMVDGMIQAMDDAVYIRQWATVYAVPSADSLGVATLEADPADADWTSELATGNEDTQMSFGRRELHPRPLAKRIKLSNKLLRLSPNTEELVRQRLGYKFGITWEKASLIGSGANQPLGVFTASSQGISTGRDVSNGNTTTAVTFDGLINAKYALKQQYWPKAKWLGHRDFFKSVALLKDTTNQYLWRESVIMGEPDRMLGLPVYMSEYSPNTFTTGQYVGILGDFSYYWIADSLSMQFQRLVELYAESNQTGLIGRLEGDGMPVLEEAFVRVKLA